MALDKELGVENIKLTDRQKRLVSYLMKQKGYQTAKGYAAELNVSERTIYSDLKKSRIF